jgi:hypothetical protein
MPPNPQSPEGPTSPPTSPPPPATPTEPRRSRQRPPLFRGTEEAPPPPPPPSSPEPGRPGEGSETGSATDGSDRDRQRRSSSPGRTTNPLAFVEPIEAGVNGISALANELLTADDTEREYGVYLADEQDAHGIAVPTSRMLSRRMREDGVLNPDLADAIAAFVALAGYVSKVFRRRAEIRRLRAADEPAEAAA